MADTETIEYTPEELEEIERILGVINSAISVTEEVEEPLAQPEPSEDELIPEPDIFDMPESSLDAFEAETPGIEAEIEAEEAVEAVEDQVLDLADVDDLSADITDLTDIPDIDMEDESGVEDITGLLQEVEEPEIPETMEAPPVEPVEDITADFEDVSEEPLPVDEIIPEEEVPDTGLDVTEDVEPETIEEPATEAPLTGTTIEQLNSLTRDEPESLDAQDLAPADEFVDEDEPADIEAAPETIEEMPETGIGEDEIPSADGIEADDGVSIGEGADADMPDLSDLSFDESAEIPEAVDADVPDIDISDIAADEAPLDDTGEGLAEAAMGDIEPSPQDELQQDGIDGFGDEAADQSLTEDLTSEVDSPDLGEPDISLLDEEEPLQIEPLDDEKPVPRPPVPESDERETVELSDKELKKLKKAILLFNPAVIQAIKEAVINDLLPPKETRQLVDMIIDGRPEDNIHRFLEKKLKSTIALRDETAVPGRRVITARPEYTAKGRERQKRLLRKTKIFGAAVAATVIFSLLGYLFIYKPLKAKSLINEGVALILTPGDNIERQKNYKKAEALFNIVEDNYQKDYLPGYNAYAKAYFKRKSYDFSIKKLNIAYQIDKKNLETLNNLGSFYSRVPKEYYHSLQSGIDRFYYPKRKPERLERDQLDVSIEFYKRALLIDKSNITAFYGIGNSYFYQGQYLKAKEYYQNILDVDPDSVIGYSGLLNLYIERNEFKEVISANSELNDKKMLDELSSPLLAKLASYYIDKKKTATGNIRIDYGVQSPRFKDINDNVYPAVRSVLKALNRRDSDYPPLYLQSARLKKTQNNLKEMERLLEKAISLTKEKYNSDNYFGALHLMGEYYYDINDPVKAYQYLNSAVKAYPYQPEFTDEEFYHETESLGRSYALTGNIFYYFFDKVKSRYGDIEDELIDSELDKMANYSIAREKYIKALEQGYSSPELFYNLGRVYYMNRSYQKALNSWLNLHEDFVNRPELMYALGNAFYHMGDYEASKGQYLQLISVYEYEADKVKIPILSNNDHIKLFKTLASVSNNLGAVYLLQNDESRSSINFWKGINYAKRINKENEFARVNLARAYKQRATVYEPILDESIPYSIDIYRDEMRK